MGSLPSRPTSPTSRTPSSSPRRPVLSRRPSTASSNSNSTIILTPPSSVGSSSSGSSVVMLTPPESVTTAPSGSAGTSCSGLRRTARSRSKTQSSDQDLEEKIPPSMWQGQILPPKLRQEPEPETRVRDWFDKVTPEPPSVAPKKIDNHAADHSDKSKRPKMRPKRQRIRIKRRPLTSIPEGRKVTNFPEPGDDENVLYFGGYTLLSAMILVFLSPISPIALPNQQLTVYVPMGVHSVTAISYDSSGGWKQNLFACLLIACFLIRGMAAEPRESLPSGPSTTTIDVDVADVGLSPFGPSITTTGVATGISPFGPPTTTTGVAVGLSPFGPSTTTTVGCEE
ncbi:hypothetical protein B0T21DRAFT_413797 [Apiosordaria backusii]|uniref:Uncharacterized protein n=1 Tax=Apiosordaria backusii TaxID=314023 RepID=A0AA40B2V8_9PEZI|nr:hypothetical protein B0T21DRAFT_413797 [Apiosordaria backusii]